MAKVKKAQSKKVRVIEDVSGSTESRRLKGGKPEVLEPRIVRGAGMIEAPQDEFIEAPRPTPKLPGLDVLRGFAVVTMLITHVWIVLFWMSDNPVGKSLSYFGGFISFTIFLMVSGFLIGLRYKTLNFASIVKRSVIILIVYLILAIVYLVPREQEFRSLLKTPIYLQEYLLTLAFFPILGYIAVWILNKLTFVKNILKHQTGAFYVIILGIAGVLIGKFAAGFTQDLALSLLIGSQSLHTFPIVSYGIVFGVGAWLGWSKREESPKEFMRESLIFTLLSAAIMFVSIPFENISLMTLNLDAIRWPPTLFFIFSSLTVAILLLIVAMQSEVHMQKFIPRALGFLGKNSLQFVVVHLLILYMIEPFAGISFSTGNMFKVVLAEMNGILKQDEKILSNIDSTFVNQQEWPFAGSKVAVMSQETPYQKGDYHVEVRPDEIGTNLAGQDVTVYVSQAQQPFIKMDHKVSLTKGAEYFVSFSLPDNTTAIAVSFNENVALPDRGTLEQQISNPGSASGALLTKINKEFGEWMHRGYSIEGRKWVILSTDKEKDGTVKAFLPFSCAEQRLLEAKQFRVEYYDLQNKVQKPECKDLSSVQNIPVVEGRAYSYAELPFSADGFKDKPGKQEVSYRLVLATDEENKEYAIKHTFFVTHPYYLVWSLDWDGFAVTTKTMETLDQIRSSNPHMKITHMLNPRSWNSSQVARSNGQAQAKFVKDRADQFGDEVALHLHMFRDMLSLAGVTVNEEAGWSNRADGYDVPLTRYGYEDSRKMFKWAIAEFKKIGLPAPVSFRAGGWFANLDNLRAAKDEGLLIDTSGRNRYTSRSFGSGPGVTGPWELSTTQQPYWISPSNQNRSTNKAASIGLYEMPNNGADSWAHSTQHMIQRFKDIHNGDALGAPKVVVFLSHPDFFNTEGPKIDTVLWYTRYFSGYNDGGPLIYTTLKEYYMNYAK
ncbi:MAG: hypothetical protein QY314_01895 [Candidatus Dojkabacteria bacterium]|nr:MAG: hypothetical protein QY314_01895 [Candidatus Dojkabacteria bacterium]